MLGRPRNDRRRLCWNYGVCASCASTVIPNAELISKKFAMHYIHPNFHLQLRQSEKTKIRKKGRKRRAWSTSNIAESSFGQNAVLFVCGRMCGRCVASGASLVLRPPGSRRKIQQLEQDLQALSDNLDPLIERLIRVQVLPSSIRRPEVYAFTVGSWLFGACVRLKQLKLRIVTIINMMPSRTENLS